jgi:hypothetical protein
MHNHLVEPGVEGRKVTSHLDYEFSLLLAFAEDTFLTQKLFKQMSQV